MLSVNTAMKRSVAPVAGVHNRNQEETLKRQARDAPSATKCPELSLTAARRVADLQAPPFLGIQEDQQDRGCFSASLPWRATFRTVTRAGQSRTLAKDTPRARRGGNLRAVVLDEDRVAALAARSVASFLRQVTPYPPRSGNRRRQFSAASSRAQRQSAMSATGLSLLEPRPPGSSACTCGKTKESAASICRYPGTLDDIATPGRQGADGRATGRAR